MTPVYVDVVAAYLVAVVDLDVAAAAVNLVAVSPNPPPNEKPLPLRHSYLNLI